MSILSKEPDGMGYYYGFAEGDHRQINVKLEFANGWKAYVGGEDIGVLELTKDDAEAAAIKWMKANQA